ncbi:hypothetical protein D3C73_1293900 [compost metagenome]
MPGKRLRAAAMFWSGKRPMASAATTFTSDVDERWICSAAASDSAMGREAVTTTSATDDAPVSIARAAVTGVTASAAMSTSMRWVTRPT